MVSSVTKTMVSGVSESVGVVGIGLSISRPLAVDESMAVSPSTLISVRISTPTPSSPVAPPCTPVSPIVCKGDHQHGSFHHEDQDHRSSREEILRLDRWLHLGFPLHLPGNVDLQAGVRRGWSRHCPPQMLL